MLRLLLVALLGVTGVACNDRAPTPTQVQGPIDLNTATTKDLEKLPGIGEHLARSIIASRNARGGRFHSVDELLKIDGIGDKTLEKIKPYVYVSP